MFKNFYIFSLLILTANVASAQSASNSDEYYINFCEKNSNQEKFLANIGKEILSNEQKRVEFISGLAKKKYPSCIEILTEYIKKIISEKEYKPKAGEQSILSLALVAKIPEATKMIELEIDKGYLSSWIDVLKETNEQGYILSLKSWIKRVGKEIREKDNTKLLNVSEYGKAQLGKEIKYPDMVRIWTPILMGRYLTEMISRKEKLTESEFNDLNIIFAASTTSYRETFLDQIIKIVENNPKVWISSFRCEEPWVEFRLFPIMKALGKKDGYIKREIIWLAKYHQDPKLRSLASATLDSVVSEKLEKTEKTKNIQKK
ncbi:hypothetical protein QEJ31_11915 [Pigmentibacter sp. JX0631]|uniref:hypothetical protein n=1 Tax=Pigmentibacter sp. JX0631 TaxID=2976982 RepID=UPI002468E2B8|nr:hypothetical protein [Pigmentibacter sp. JX0631]WGL59228.1 hypothetical protein QEJ31_11915 [Pigmentibacter sp. JX0631]